MTRRSPTFYRDAHTTPRLALLRAGHLPPTLAVTAFTTALAIDAGRGLASIGVTGAVLCGQLTVGWSNDFVDRDRDRIAGRLDKPIVSGHIEAAVVCRAAVLAAVACVPLSLMSGWRAGIVHLAAVATALTYNWRLKNTPFSVVPYVIAFGSLPAFVSLGLAHHPDPPAWSMIAGGLLGAGAHFINTLPDLADDAATGIRGLPHRLGATASLFIGAGLLAAATTVVLVAPRSDPSAASAVLAAVAFGSVLGVLITSAGGRRRTAWSLCMVAAGATIALYLTRRSL